MPSIKVTADSVFIKFSFIMPHKNKVSKGGKEYINYAGNGIMQSKILYEFHKLLVEHNIEPYLFDEKVVFCIRRHYPSDYKPSKDEPKEIMDCDNFEIKPLIDVFTGVFYRDDSGSELSIFQEKIKDDTAFPYTEIAIWKRSKFFQQNGDIYFD